MIAVMRRIFVIAILLGIMSLLTYIGTPGNLAYPVTMAVLGFMILASFTLGELFALIKLPRVLGYLAAGALFGLPSYEVLQQFGLNLITPKVIDNLGSVNNIALAVIAFAAGLHLKLTKIKKIFVPALVIFFVKLIVVFLLVTASVYFLYPVIMGTLPDSNLLIAGGLLISVISMGTSLELTMAVADELEINNNLTDLTLGTTILKDIFNILLLAGVIYIVNSSLLSTGATDLNGAANSATAVATNGSAASDGGFSSLLTELGYTVVAGIILGGIVVLYLRFVRLEITFFLVCLLVFGGYASILLDLETLLLFVIAGMVAVNFSDTEELEKATSNFSLPVYIVFFALAGASLDVANVSVALPIAAVLFLVRIVAVFLSVRISAGVLKSSEEIKRYGWSGFISTGILMLGFLQIIGAKIPAITGFVSPVIYDLILLNLILGPVLFRVALTKQKKSEEIAPVTDENVRETDEIKKKLKAVDKDFRVVFSEPNFDDQNLNKMLFDLYFRVLGLVSELKDSFIYKRNSESQELLEETVALYRNMFISVENIIKSGKDARSIKATLQNLRINQTDSLLHHLNERKSEERTFAEYDSFLKGLLNKLVDITELLPESYSLSVKTSLATMKNKPFKFKLYILNLHFRAFWWKLFSGGKPITLKIELRNFARYFIGSVITKELKETVNLVGADRLNLYRKLKAIHKNFITYLDEMITITGQEKSSLGFVTVFFMRYEELKEMFFNELDVYISEQALIVEEIEKRLSYAFASPYNNFLKYLDEIQRVEKREGDLKLFPAFEESQKVKEELIDSLRYWVVYYQGMIGFIEKELYIYRFEIQLNNFLDRALLNLADEVSQAIRVECSQILIQFRKFSEDLEKRLPEGYDKLKSYSDNFRISEHIEGLTLVVRELEKASRSRKLRTFLDTVINGIKSLAKELPEEAEFLEESDLLLPERTPRFIELKSYKISKLTENFLLSRFPREIGDVNEFLVNYVESSLKEFRNLESSVIYYIESIVKRLEEDPGDIEGAKDIIASLTENFVGRVRDIESNNDKLEISINEQVSIKTAAAIAQINELIPRSVADDDVIHPVSQKLADSLYTAYKYIKVHLHLAFHKIYQTGKALTERVIRPLIRRSIDSFRVLSGKTPPLHKEDLFRIQEILEQLPFIYRRLFDGTSLESSEFFKGEEEIRKLVDDAQMRFKMKLPSSILMVGAPGSGKSSSIYFMKKSVFRPGDYIELNFLERISEVDELRKIISYALGYNELKTIDSIILDLNERYRNKYILLIDLHKIFIRKVDGFGALKAMLHIISMTANNVIWIVTVQSIAWQFIKNNFNAGNLFNFTLQLEDLNRNKMRDIIIKRQETAGFRFKFAKDEIYLLRKRILSSTKHMEEQAYLSRIYFDRLSDYANGNIVAGMNFWLNSILTVEENTLTIKTYQPFPYIDLSFLDVKLMTALHAVLLHGGMKKNQLADCMNIYEKEAGEILNKLFSFNLLRIGELTKGHDYFYTNKFKFKSIERELKIRNLLPCDTD